MGAPALIRPAAPEDVSVILRFIRELAEYERLADACVATEELLRDALFPDLGAPVARVLLAEEDGVPVGFALWFPSFSTFLARAGVWLEDLFVVPSARGRGIGQALLDSLAEIAAQSGGRLEWSVLKWNTPSIEFYERLGAERMEEWVTYRLETYSDS